AARSTRFAHSALLTCSRTGFRLLRDWTGIKSLYSRCMSEKGSPQFLLSPLPARVSTRGKRSCRSLRASVRRSGPGGSYGHAEEGRKKGSVDRGSEEASREGKGIHALARRAESATARAPLGGRRRGLRLRRPRRQADALRALRRAEPVSRLSLHVRS